MAGHGDSPARARELLDEVPAEALSSAARNMLTACQKRLEDEAVTSLDRLCEELPQTERQSMLELAFGHESAPEISEAESAVMALRVGLLQGRLQEIQRRIGETEDGGEQERLLREKLATAREIQALESGAGPEPGRALAGGE
jgi:hypothetical protein